MTQLTSARYSRGVRVFHWLTVLLIAGAYVTVNVRTLLEKGTPERTLVMQSHFLFGLAVLLVALPRIVSRLGSKAPPIQPPPPDWMHRAGHLTHGLLYAFIIVQPLLGLVAGLVEGGVGLPGGLRIPELFGPDKALSHDLKAIHVWLGTAFYYVIGLHILAALFHLWVRRDNTLQRML
ncbi:cytochrome b561 [Pseudoxanthomonas sp. GM95]|nr:cytochrome b561 [Pseudoxanthomonas sp. GM95]